MINSRVLSTYLNKNNDNQQRTAIDSNEVIRIIKLQL